MNQDLIAQIRYIIKKHDTVKENLLKLSSLLDATPEQKGKIAILLSTYRNDLETLKQEAGEAIKMINRKKED